MKSLEKMTGAELRNHIAEAERHLADRERQEKSELKEKMSAMAEAAGFSLHELMGGRTKKGRGAAEIKYQHPDDSTMTWTGRGRKPKWLSGEKNPEKYRIA